MVFIADYTDLSLLLADLQKQIDLAMIDDKSETGVAKVAKDVMYEEIQKEVYDVYTPKIYVRKQTNYGLQDELHNMQITPIDGGFVLENIRTNWDGGPNTNIPYAIEMGWGNQRYAYNKPRPFNEATLNILANGLAQLTLKKGLQAKGLQVE